jgi:hypothetical protein
MPDISANARCADNIVQPQLPNRRVALQQQRQRLADAAGGAQHGDAEAWLAAGCSGTPLQRRLRVGGISVREWPCLFTLKSSEPSSDRNSIANVLLPQGTGAQETIITPLCAVQDG